MISDVVGERIRELRNREGLSRDELAMAARDAGAPDAFTAAVVGYLETGRRGQDGRRTREFSLDELLWLAAGLEVAPIELLGEDQVALFVGGAEGEARSDPLCPHCNDSEPGQLEAVVRAGMVELAELTGIEASLAETAYGLARAIDYGAGEDGRLRPALTKELRATLDMIAAGRRALEAPEDEEDEFGDISEPD